MKQDNIPLPPENGWAIEIRQLTHERGWDFDTAFACVMLRYLNEGDVRPLGDLLTRRKRPGESSFLVLAMMLAPMRAQASEERVQIQYRFVLSENRGPGRPRRDDAALRKDRVQSVVEVLMTGAVAMSGGQDPGARFWTCLRRAIIAGVTRTVEQDFPLKATLVRVDGRKGRRRDPELRTRDEALAWFVEQRINRGDGYESAVIGTRDSIERTARDESRSVKLGEETIRAAYDARSRGKGVK